MPSSSSALHRPPLLRAFLPLPLLLLLAQATAIPVHEPHTPYRNSTLASFGHFAPSSTHLSFPSLPASLRPHPSPAATGSPPAVTVDVSTSAAAAAADAAAIAPPRAATTGFRPKHPFDVSIDRVKYYGGLVTYTHRLHPARICRVLNACLSPDGTLHLPSWLQRHDDILTFHCGLKSLDFSLPDTFPPPPLHNLDLVGVSVPRPTMPLFIADFFPAAVVFDLIYGNRNVTQVCHSRKGQDCELFPDLADGLRAAVMLPSRLRDFDEKKSWVREFVKLMKPPATGRLPLVIYDDMLHEPEAEMTCFRSALFTRGPFNSHIVMPDHLRDINFMSAHGLNKSARTFPAHHDRHDAAAPTATATATATATSATTATAATTAGTAPSSLCAINITISNRRMVEGAHNRLIGRYVVNVPQLKEAVILQAARIPGLHVEVATMALEGRSLRWQINAMQKTDIWVAGHGPLLTNMLFLRENSTLIEMQPFAYYPQTFETMAARLANVRYDRYITHPDVEAFETCVTQLFPRGHVAHERAMDIVHRFTRAAHKFALTDSTHALVLHVIPDTDLHHIKTCAQMQRFDMDVHKFAVTIVRHARLTCGLPRP